VALSSSDEHGLRLQNPNDFVRIEIEAALARNICVIPVLIDGAKMPKEKDLPETLRPLVYRQGVHLTHENFTTNAEMLINSLQKIVVPARVGTHKVVGISGAA